MPALPASAGKVFGENGGELTLREMYADIPNGTVMADGNVLLYYSLWDFEARYQNALYYDNRFDPEIVPLPFETDEAREEFLAGYRGDTWYLLDIVYSTRLLPAPGSDPSEEEPEALFAASSFAYVVKSAESGLVSVILSSKNGEEFQVHIEADEDGEALSASLIQFEEEVTEIVIEEEKPEEEEVQEEDALAEEEATEEEMPAAEEEQASEPENPAASETPAAVNPPVTEEPAAEESSADEESPAAEETPAVNEDQEDEENKEGTTEEESPAASEDANEETGASETGEQSDETPAAPAEEGPSEPSAPSDEASDEASDADQGIVSALRGFFFTATVYAEDAPAATENPVETPAAPVQTSETPADEASEDSAPADSEPVADSEPAVSAPEAPAAGTPDSEDPTDGPAATEESNNDAAEGTDETAANEEKHVIIEVSLNETKEVLAGFTELLEENIEARSLAALEISPRRFAAAKNADPSNALLGDRSGGLGSALKSALSSVGASAVYGADGDKLRYFPVNLYNYMGTLTGNVSGNSGVATYATNYNNFNTPARLVTQSYSQYYPYFSYTYNGTAIQDYFLFNAPTVTEAANPLYPLTPYLVQHGTQNQVVQGVRSGIAKSDLSGGPDGALEINYVTMSDLGLFPKINEDLQDERRVYIYGNNTPTGVQQDTEDTNPGMIQAYPNYGLPFVNEGNGYYSFDSDRERVYVSGGVSGNKQKTLTSASYSGGPNVKKSFFPFNETELKGNPAAEQYNFGMSMAVDFVLPPDGKVNGEDMVFEFSGDDDLWVYIDGKLVLDIGGVHPKQSGSINFATNAVTNGPDLALAGGPYSIHTLKVFYMERHPVDSNCKIRFNLPVIEPDKLNVFKFADESTSPNEGFGFDVYTADGSTQPPNDFFGDPQLKSSKTLKKGESFTVEIPAGGSWVRVVEQPKRAEGSTEDEYSTVFLGSGIDNGVQNGKDSGWIRYEGGETSSLFCVNYTKHPVELTKYRLDQPTRKGGDTPEDASDDTLAYQTMAGVTFELYKDSVGAGNKIASNLTTDTYGKIIFNDPYTPNSPALVQNAQYILRETGAPDHYEAAPDIHFSTTDGVSPKVKKIWYYDEGGTEITYPSEGGGDGNGQIVFASESGRSIRLYDKRLTGSVTVSKTIAAVSQEKIDAQGEPIFLFRLEKFKEDGDLTGPALSTQSAHVKFTTESSGEGGNFTETATFDNLEAGYFYRISELDTMRYGLDVGSPDLDGAADTDGADNDTVTFLLTGDLAKNSTTITASFANSRNYENYLSDTLVAVNRLTYTPPWPEASAPLVYTVDIRKNNQLVATKYVTAGDFIDISGLGVNPSTAKGSEGAIGKIGGADFYPYTPITGNCTIILFP
jgi:fibro-slime domain-containing protein